MTEPMLPSLDVLGSDEDLAAAARSEGEPGPRQAAEGRDETRAVTVRMGPSGRVSDVLISSWWRDDLTPATLPAALVEAYRNAAVQTIQVPAAIQVPAGARAAGAPAVEPIPPGLDDVAWFEEIRRANDRAAATLERAEELTRRGAPSRVVTGGAAIVRLHVTGGTVTAAEIDVHAVMQESPATVAADAREAFQALTTTDEERAYG